MKKVILVFLFLHLNGLAGGEERGTQERFKEASEVQDLLKDLPCVVDQREHSPCDQSNTQNEPSSDTESDDPSLLSSQPDSCNYREEVEKAIDGMAFTDSGNIKFPLSNEAYKWWKQAQGLDENKDLNAKYVNKVASLQDKIVESCVSTTDYLATDASPVAPQLNHGPVVWKNPYVIIPAVALGVGVYIKLIAPYINNYAERCSGSKRALLKICALKKEGWNSFQKRTR